MVTSPIYDKSHKTKNPWQPNLPDSTKSFMNRSSSNVNIITGEENLHSGILRLHHLERYGAVNRRKGITEIRDLSRLTSAKACEDYTRAF